MHVVDEETASIERGAVDSGVIADDAGDRDVDCQLDAAAGIHGRVGRFDAVDTFAWVVCGDDPRVGTVIDHMFW